MIQKTYHISDYSQEKMDAVLTQVSSLSAYQNAGQVLLLMFEQNWDTGKIEKKVEQIRTQLPKAEIAGITHYDNVDAADYQRESTILTFLLFERPSFSLLSLPLDAQREEEIGLELGRQLSAIQHVRCVLTLFSRQRRDIEAILRQAGQRLDNIPMLGATAGMEEVFLTDHGNSFVFDEKGCHPDLLLAVVFHGSELHAKVSYNFGWIPVGKVMTVTETADDFTVTKIDGVPAAELYRNYLGLSYQSRALNMMNICEFPLTIERSGVAMARIPYAWTAEGALKFQIPIRKGERIRLSYGCPPQLFSQIAGDIEAFRSFRPEAILMVVCMNRMIFLGDQEHLETDAYRSVNPEMAFLHGNSEVYWQQGWGGEMHSALLAVGLREGVGTPVPMKDWDSCPVKSAQSEEVIPLQLRLMSFMRAVTGDLERATEELLHLKDNLEDEVERKTRENESLELHVVQTLAEAIDAKDTYTNGHSSRVAAYSMEIARRYGYSRKAQNEIYMMGLLHDVGKIGVPDAVINKPGRLNDEEFEKIKNHPVMGARILKKIREMPKLVTGARWHHERYDGRGYPDGLKGTDIPEEARIIGVADAYDAMTSNRSYRNSMPQSAVREQIEKGKGTQFDPVFADLMIQMIDEDTEYKMREV